MPSIHTEQFGELHYDEASALLFPRGLPGFEQSRRFVLLDNPDFAPVVHLQSLETGNLCFLALPVRSVDPDYETILSEEDREALGLADADQPTVDLALLSAAQDGSLSANLLAPVVIHLAKQRGVQAVRFDSRYSHKEPLCS
ncbi:MAG: flagellar assembly protein FliW [Bryobacteraceae bacterium]